MGGENDKETPLCNLKTGTKTDDPFLSSMKAAGETQRMGDGSVVSQQPICHFLFLGYLLVFAIDPANKRNEFVKAK